MFNKNEFAKILQKIVSQYDSISSFTEKSSLDRTYISKCINKKLEHPPSPNILRKISNNSNNITNYIILMYTCGYLNDNDFVYFDNLKLNANNSKNNYSADFYFIKNNDIQTNELYNKLNEDGQEKVNNYIQDLINTNKYNKKKLN